MSRGIEELLKMQSTLLKQGRGFNLQSHGTNAAGDEFFNFALYPLNKAKGSYYYFHHADPLVIVEKLKEYMVPDKVAEDIIEKRDEPSIDDYDDDLDGL